MSCVFPIYTEECLSKENVFNFVKELKGQIGQIGEFSQGVITKDKATIWIYYRGSDIKSEVSTIEQVKKLFDIDINTEVAVEIGHGDYSEKLAANFCINFLELYPKSIVRYGGFLRLNEVKKWYDAPIIEY